MRLAPGFSAVQAFHDNRIDPTAPVASLAILRDDHRNAGSSRDDLRNRERAGLISPRENDSLFEVWMRRIPRRRLGVSI